MPFEYLNELTFKNIKYSHFRSITTSKMRHRLVNWPPTANYLPGNCRHFSVQSWKIVRVPQYATALRSVKRPVPTVSHRFVAEARLHTAAEPDSFVARADAVLANRT